VAEFNLVRGAILKQFNHGTNLTSCEIVFRQINCQRHYVKELDFITHGRPQIL